MIMIINSCSQRGNKLNSLHQALVPATQDMAVQVLQKCSTLALKYTDTWLPNMENSGRSPPFSELHDALLPLLPDCSPKWIKRLGILFQSVRPQDKRSSLDSGMDFLKHTLITSRAKW